MITAAKEMTVVTENTGRVGCGWWWDTLDRVAKKGVFEEGKWRQRLRWQGVCFPGKGNSDVAKVSRQESAQWA